MYTSIDQIKEANAAAGHHWFEESTMRFFKSRISSQVIAGRYFISTEKGPDEIRKATIRVALDDGTVEDLGGFQAFRAPAHARRALDRNLKEDIVVKFDPYEHDTTSTEESVESFCWRPYLGYLEVGTRTTHAKACEIAEQLAGVKAA